LTAFYFSLLVFACLSGVLLAVLQFPGTWLILAAAAGYGWHRDWIVFGWKGLLVLATMAALGELIELGAGLWTARRAGASRRASWYALIGGILGMLLLGLPIPIIGTVLGGIAGCFAGAIIAEVSLGNRLSGATRVGTAAALGRIAGIAGKLSMALAMAGLTVALTIIDFIGDTTNVH
jgi:uncharacterized protein YqgC (DUF456 family)